MGLFVLTTVIEKIFGKKIFSNDDDEDYEEQSRRASHAEALIWLKKQAEAKRRSENPYDNDLLNELHHEGAPSKMLDKMSEGLWLLITGRFLNHRSVHPYRTKEVRVEYAKHAMVGIDGRLMKTPVGPFVVSVNQEVINFLIPQ